MSEVIEISGTPIVIGMDWAMHPNKAAQRQALKAASKRLMHIVRPTDDGFLQGITHDKVPAKALPAALALATVTSDAIIFHEFDADRVWVCGIMNSTPLSGTDKVTTVAEARKAVTELMSMLPGATIIGTLSGASAPVEDVWGRIEPAEIKTMYLRASGVSMGMVAVVLITPVILAAGMIGYKQWTLHQMELREAAENARAMLMQQESSRERQKREADAFNANMHAQRDALVRGVPAHAQYQQWRDAILGLDTFHEGYRLDEAQCARSPLGTSTCTLTWKTQGTGSTRALPTSALTLPGKPQATLETEPQTLVNGATSTIELPALEVIDITADEPGAVLRIVSKAQLLGIEMQFSPATPVSVVPVNAGANAAPVLLGKRGTFTSQLQSLVHAEGLMTVLNDTSLRLRNVRFEGIATNRIRVKVEGDYVSAPSTK